MENEKRLIDANTLVGADGIFEKRGCRGNCQYCSLWSTDGCRVILDAPTVDAVEVVRCKDCVHMKHQFNARFCEVWCMYNGMGDEGFCNYGERKDNES